MFTLYRSTRLHLRGEYMFWLTSNEMSTAWRINVVWLTNNNRLSSISGGNAQITLFNPPVVETSTSSQPKFLFYQYCYIILYNITLYHIILWIILYCIIFVTLCYIYYNILYYIILYYIILYYVLLWTTQSHMRSECWFINIAQLTSYSRYDSS